MRDSSSTVPPGHGRVAMAARAGLFPRSGVVSGGLALLAVAAVIAFAGQDFGRSLVALVRRGLTRAAASPSDPWSALKEVLYEGTLLILPILAAAFLAALAGAILPAIIARRHRGRSVVPLPDAPAERLPLAILHALGVCVAVLLTAQIMRSHSGFVWRVAEGELGAGAELLAAFSEILACLGAVMLLVGLIEVAVLRRAIWKALHLSSLEARREERAAGGDAAIKREGMRRARREALR
ncbi:MAG: hypothetical protein GY854_04865, partial [Deltaproteobacteria bacterium]|nr:hypothetical protein [Deltaproteobacteria bacterium]